MPSSEDDTTESPPVVKCTLVTAPPCCRYQRSASGGPPSLCKATPPSDAIASSVPCSLNRTRLASPRRTDSFRTARRVSTDQTTRRPSTVEAAANRPSGLKRMSRHPRVPSGTSSGSSCAFASAPGVQSHTGPSQQASMTCRPSRDMSSPLSPQFERALSVSRTSASPRTEMRHGRGDGCPMHVPSTMRPSSLTRAGASASPVESPSSLDGRLWSRYTRRNAPRSSETTATRAAESVASFLACGATLGTTRGGAEALSQTSSDPFDLSITMRELPRTRATCASTIESSMKVATWASATRRSASMSGHSRCSSSCGRNSVVSAAAIEGSVTEKSRMAARRLANRVPRSDSAAMR